jgi:hypothetical protein
MYSLPAGHFQALAFTSFTALVDRRLFPDRHLLRNGLEMGDLQAIGARDPNRDALRIWIVKAKSPCGHAAQAHGNLPLLQWCTAGRRGLSDDHHLSVCGRARCFGLEQLRTGESLFRHPIRADEFAQGLRRGPGRGIGEAFYPGWAFADFHAVRRELGRERVGHQSVAGARAKA